MNIIYNQTTGYPNQVLSTVCRRISAFTRKTKVCNFKIGITCNPERRWREAYANEYDNMLVVYQSTSVRFVRNLEYELINHNWIHCDNVISGGGGGKGSASPFYLYVVRKH
jgi:hypothetical protein